MKEIFAQFSEFWKKLGPNQKVAVLLVSIIAIVAVGGMVMWAQQPQYAHLMGNLSQEDSAAIISYLGQNNIPYQASPDGSSISVLREKMNDVRAAVVERGLVQGGDQGFSLLDKSTLSWTDALQGVNITRAIQGEISNTLKKMSFINSAKVIVSPAEKSLYLKEEKPAKASVILQLKPGMTPTQSQILSVVMFVSNAFPGLKQEQVMVTDQNGKLLHAPSDNNAEASSSSLASTRMDYQLRQESHLAERAQDVLDKAFGPGKTIVHVAVTVKDPPPHERTIVKDKKSALKSESKKDRSNQSGTETTTGDTSAKAKTEGAGQGGTGTSSKESDGETRKEYYDPGSKITETVPVGYSIARLSVSLIIDKTLEAQKLDIETQVKRAVGWDDKERKDEPVVAAVSEIYKPETVTPPEETLMDKVTAHMDLITYGGNVLIAIVFLFILKGVIKKSGKKGAAGGPVTGPDGAALPPEVIARLMQRRSTEALITGDGEGASRVAKKWMATAKK